MGDYSITFARSARKELEKLPSNAAGRILDKIQALSKLPRPEGVTKLHGQKNLWRIRAGDYRVVYSVNDSNKAIDIFVIRHRRDVYRDL
jgi:mRNA interferase RelE/StbE